MGGDMALGFGAPKNQYTEIFYFLSPENFR